MSRKTSLLKSRSVGFIIISACVVIILAMVASLFFATFTGFKTGIGGAVNTQTRELSTQIVYNYENYIGSIIETSNIIQADLGRYDIADAHDSLRLNTFFEEIIHLQRDIISISVYDYESRLCLASSRPSAIGETVEASTEWFSSAIGDPTVHVFSLPFAEFGSEDYRINVSRRVRLQGGDTAGVLKIEVSFHRFPDLVDKSNLGEGGHVTIIDPAYGIVYTSVMDEQLVEEEIGVVREIVLGSGTTVLGGRQINVNVDTLSGTKWRICVFINIDKLVEIEQSYLTTIILIACVILIAGIFMFTGVARTITTPMKQLELAMSKVENSDYFRMEEVRLTTFREIDALTRRFNRMMRKIGELMERVLAERDAQLKSELKALRNQINPHFLFNTLDSIVWLIENEKNDEAAGMVVALAKLFRVGISNDSEVVPVRDEIEHVRNYLLIQQIRYPDSFEYSFDIEEGSLELQTMKLVLQPVVENCIYHGLKNKIDRGTIHICARTEGDSLLLSIADNGYGMRSETIDELFETFRDGVVSNSVGLKNIYQRVMIYYAGKADMIIESELDEGTIVTIRQPLSKI